MYIHATLISPSKHRQYNEANQQEAVQWLNQNVHANWGGTEILSVLEAIYKMPLAKGGSRQVGNMHPSDYTTICPPPPTSRAAINYDLFSIRPPSSLNHRLSS